MEFLLHQRLKYYLMYCLKKLVCQIGPANSYWTRAPCAVKIYNVEQLAEISR